MTSGLPDETATRHSAQIELRDLELASEIGTYGPGDVVPEAHLLDLTLSVPPGLVQVGADDMALVFDYDPLIAEIDRIAREHPCETQEYLLSRIARACASYPQITGLDICLRKRPLLRGTGSLGVRLRLGPAQLADLRDGD